MFPNKTFSDPFRQSNIPNQPLDMFEIQEFARPYDMLRVISGAYEHYAIMLDRRRVFHIRKDYGLPAITSLNDCLIGRKAFLERMPTHEYDAIVIRLREVVNNPKKYDLLVNNCEHMVRYILTGKAESRQIYRALICVSIVSLVLVSLRN